MKQLFAIVLSTAAICAFASATPAAAQDTQDIVLRSGEAVDFEQGLGAAGQGVGGAHQGDEDAGFEAGLRIAFPVQRPFHVSTILVITTNVKRNVWG